MNNEACRRLLGHNGFPGCREELCRVPCLAKILSGKRYGTVCLRLRDSLAGHDRNGLAPLACLERNDHVGTAHKLSNTECPDEEYNSRPNNNHRTFPPEPYTQKTDARKVAALSFFRFYLCRFGRVNPPVALRDF